jgi:hypothetical protein
VRFLTAEQATTTLLQLPNKNAPKIPASPLRFFAAAPKPRAGTYGTYI